MRVLADTSVWSAALQHEKAVDTRVVDRLGALVSGHQVEIIGPIRQELLSGIRTQLQFEKLQGLLAAFPDLAIGAEDYVTAAKFFNLCRAKGIQGSNTDYLICAVAVRNNLAVFATDGDLALFARHIPIVLYEIK
ncbi:MAG: PIN domain nuclease [Verrucomicrobia bacterium]|nr:PIN domain nuclease [Verrucomicrobiota bacterium]